MVAVIVPIIARLGTSWFLIGAAVIGFIFIHRISGILYQQETMERLCRGYFLMESIVIPFLTVPSFHTASARDIVSPVLIPLAAISCFGIRLFVLLLVQRTLRGTWHFRIRNTLLPAGLILAVLLVMAAWPFVATGPLYLIVPLMKWLDPLIVWMQSVFSKVQPQQPNEAGPNQEAIERVQWDYHAPNIPDWAFLLAVMLAVVAVWYVFNNNNRVQAAARQTTFQPEVQIKRMRWSANPSLQFLSTTAPIRQIYQQMLRWLETKGWPITPGETPREYAQRVESQQLTGHEATREVWEITKCYEHSRYGAETQTVEDDPTVLKAREALERMKST
ncbi:DUF4129 domain-containing protein [Cohnella pontilimi]|uniref:DUF4129 domain-containing protein n=1 Tax=Cohnella pontilimi TaxID=2564100 RepID=UPI001B803D2D|nr:DUF4129 domain-containing protein [Cohnella pontilimi]